MNSKRNPAIPVRGTSLAWETPRTDTERVCLAISQWIDKNETLTRLLAGRELVIMVGDCNSDEIGSMGRGMQVADPILDPRGNRVMARILGMHVQVLKKFTQDNPAMKEALFRLIRGVVVDS